MEKTMYGVVGQSVGDPDVLGPLGSSSAVLRIRIHRIHMFLGLLDPDPLVRGMDPDPSIIMQK